MAQNAAMQGRLVMSDGTVDPEAGMAQGLASAASPVILGLVAPILLMMVIDPSMLRHAQFLIIAVLIPMLLVSIALYAYSVINPGEVAGLIADPSNRMLQIVQSNRFATRRTELPFNEIDAIRMTSVYDRDGYAVQRGEIELQSGMRIELPTVLGVAEVKALKFVVGL